MPAKKFFSVGKYMLIGALVASLTQTLSPERRFFRACVADGAFASHHDGGCFFILGLLNLGRLHRQKLSKPLPDGRRSGIYGVWADDGH